MGVVSEMLGNEGPLHTVEWKGKIYPIKLIDQSVQAEFEKKLFEQDRSKIMKLHDVGISSDEEFNAEIERIKTAFRAGDYEMLSEAGLKRLATLDGVKLLLSLIVPCSQMELFALIHARTDEMMSKVQLVIQESFPGVDLSAAAKQQTAPTGTSAPNP